MSKFTEAHEQGAKQFKYMSIGVCGGCATCADQNSYDDMALFSEDVAEGKACDEGYFSHAPCIICGSKLGGYRYAVHSIDEDDNLQHDDGACQDCLVYWANGGEPEEWSVN